MASKVLIFGYGLFGQAMFHILVRKPALSVSVFLRTPSADRKELALAEKVYHRACELPLKQFEIVMITVPSYAIAESLQSVLPTGSNDPMYVSCAKGIDSATGLFPSQLIGAITKAENVAILSGPSFAEELIANKRTCVTVASKSHATRERLRERLTSDLLGIQLTPDTHGLEILGVAKNLIALGSGMIDGLELSENFRAAFIAAGIKELMRILPQLGAEAETVTSFGGIADVLLTSVSKKSRNYRMGFMIGNKQSCETLMSEGLHSATSFARYISHASVHSRFFESVASSISHPEKIVEAVELG